MKIESVARKEALGRSMMALMGGVSEIMNIKR